MGERKAILHIGTHKTGTTFLQSHFSARAASLRAEGVLWVSDAYNLPGAIIEAERSGRRDALLAHVRRGLDAAFAQAGTLLLSSEGFSGFAGNGYRDTPALAAFCGGMLAGIQVTVVVYLRRQDRFYESYYTQMIQQGESYDLATFRERVPHASLRWLPIIEAYEDALPGCRLVVQPYDRRAFRGQDILADFIDHTGLKGLTGGGAGSQAQRQLFDRGVEAGSAAQRRLSRPGFAESHPRRPSRQQCDTPVREQEPARSARATRAAGLPRRGERGHPRQVLGWA